MARRLGGWAAAAGRAAGRPSARAAGGPTVGRPSGQAPGGGRLVAGPPGAQAARAAGRQGAWALGRGQRGLAAFSHWLRDFLGLSPSLHRAPRLGSGATLSRATLVADDCWAFSQAHPRFRFGWGLFCRPGSSAARPSPCVALLDRVFSLGRAPRWFGDCPDWGRTRCCLGSAPFCASLWSNTPLCRG